MNLVKINSINIIDELEVGDWDVSNGTKHNNSTRKRSIGYISVTPNTEYYALGNNRYVLFYNENKQYVSSTLGTGWLWGSNFTFTTPNWCYYITFYTDVEYIQDAQICLNSCAEKTTYHPHWVLGLDGQGKAFTADISSMLPSGIGCFVMGNTWRMRSAGVFMTDNAPSDAEVSGDTAGADCICNKYRREDAGYLIGANRSGICLRPSYWEESEILVCDSNFSDATSFGNYINGTVLIYKKATT